MRVLLHFQFVFLLFLFLLWLPWIGHVKLCWIIVVRVDILVLFLSLEGKLLVFTIENNVCCGLFIYCLYYVKVGSFYTHLLKQIFTVNGCWILPKAFSASIEMIIWFLSFNLLIWCITLIDFCVLKNPCIPGINPT